MDCPTIIIAFVTLFKMHIKVLAMNMTTCLQQFRNGNLWINLYYKIFLDGSTIRCMPIHIELWWSVELVEKHQTIELAVLTPHRLAQHAGTQGQGKTAVQIF